jgi:hypothetical protein
MPVIPKVKTGKGKAAIPNRLRIKVGHLIVPAAVSRLSSNHQAARMLFPNPA